MNKKNRIKQIVVIVIVTSLFAVFLCGCTENIGTNNGVDLSKFLGTWTGNMETSMFGFRGNGSAWNMTDFRENRTAGNITKLEFTVDTLYMTITIGNETQTIPQTYTMEGGQLILSMQFTDERPGWMQPPPDGEQPPFEGESPPDRERPTNGERPSITRSYAYSLNENYDVLYLNGSPFKKAK